MSNSEGIPGSNTSASGLKKIVFPRWLILAFGLVAASVLTGGFWFYHSQGRLAKREAEENLQTIAQLKLDQIASWLAERRADAFVAMENPFYIQTLTRWKAAPQAAMTSELVTQFRSLKENYLYYDVLLVDAGGEVLLSLGGYRGPLHDDAARALTVAFTEKRPVLTDLYAAPGGLPPHLDVIAPFFFQGGERAGPAGAVILQSDARRFLYPLIESWPVPSRTAETMLVRRDGDTVLFLNELRHQKDTGLKLRIPLSQESVPAVMAVLGREGVVQGRDYRGIEVLAALKAVPGSAWFLVAKVDKEEAFANWRSRSLLILSLILILLVAASVGFMMLWHSVQANYYRGLSRAETALHESETRYHTSLISIGDGVITTNADGRVELLNPVAERLTGWTLNEARGRPLEEVFHIVNEETRQEVDNPICRVVREGQVIGLANHTLLIGRDGTEHAVADSGAPIRNEAGEIMGVVLVFRDQTAERAAHEAMRGERLRLRTLIDAMPDYIFVKDAQSRFVTTNSAHLRAIGAGSLEEVVGKTDLELFPRELADRYYKDERRIINSGEPLLDREERVIEHSGAEKYVLTTKIPLRDEQGHVTGLVGISRDITGRKRAEEALSRSNQELRDTLLQLERSRDMLQLIIESIPVRVFWKDKQLRYLGCNTLFARDAGFSHPRDLLGKDDFAMGWRAEAEIYRADDRRVIESRQPKMNIIEPQTTPEGAKVWLSTSKVPLQVPNGDVIGVLGAYEDITERKKDEEKLRAALEEREVMLREIHHRVKNNMQIISSLLRLQSRYAKDDKAQEVLNESQNRIRSIALIHENLYQSQDFSRIDFSDYLTRMITHLFAIYKVDSRRIKYQVDAKNVRLDINQAIPCGLIINELITNALKHAFPEDREGEVLVRMRPLDGDGYELAVKDNGVGLPKGFDLRQKGSLGFQIVSDLVKQIEGSIEIRRDAGTEIIIRW
jgi:PAS domain S-box-containing protein